jgi:hypothetical protein
MTAVYCTRVFVPEIEGIFEVKWGHTGIRVKKVDSENQHTVKLSTNLFAIGFMFEGENFDDLKIILVNDASELGMATLGRSKT